MDMKISNPEHILKQMPDARSPLKTAPDSRAFADALGQALRPDKSGDTQSVSPTLGPASISGIQFTRLPAASPVNAAEKVDNLLAHLEGYQKLLADPSQSLKSIAPQLVRLEQGMAALERAIEKLDDADNLKSIAQEALVTAAAEAFKFNRGDYNPS
jgi:hypothetical protein